MCSACLYVCEPRVRLVTTEVATGISYRGCEPPLWALGLPLQSPARAANAFSSEPSLQPQRRVFVFKIHSFYFMCMSVLSACVFVRYTAASCPWGSEEGAGCSGTGRCELRRVLGAELGSSARATPHPSPSRVASACIPHPLLFPSSSSNL